jgi:IS1 family transposase
MVVVCNDKNSGIIPVWNNGKKTDDVFLKLFALLSLIPIALYFTDDWGTYTKIFAKRQALYFGQGYDMED